MIPIDSCNNFPKIYILKLLYRIQIYKFTFAIKNIKKIVEEFAKISCIHCFSGKFVKWATHRIPEATIIYRNTSIQNK